jgi:hypothetical protein
MRLRPGGIDVFYIDESNDAQFYVMSAVAVPFMRQTAGVWNIVWPEYLDAAKGWRKTIRIDLDIPTSKELHGVQLASGRGNGHDDAGFSTACVHRGRMAGAYVSARVKDDDLIEDEIVNILPVLLRPSGMGRRGTKHSQAGNILPIAIRRPVSTVNIDLRLRRRIERVGRLRHGAARLLCIAVILLPIAGARAALSGPESQLEAEARALQAGILQVTSSKNYRLWKLASIQPQAIFQIYEYVNPMNNLVFAVTWQGQRPFNLLLVLGFDVALFRGPCFFQTLHYGRISTDTLFLEMMTRIDVFAGHAVRLDNLPAGVTEGDIIQ